MTIRYNWEAIKKYTKNDIKKILNHFRIMFKDKDRIEEYLINNEYARKIIKDNFSTGLSYMENVSAFLDNSMNATENEMYVYLDLVSKRDFFTYLNTRKKVNYLQDWKIVDKYDIKKLKNNRLLSIHDNKIFFIYEGVN